MTACAEAVPNPARIRAPAASAIRIRFIVHPPRSVEPPSPESQAFARARGSASQACHLQAANAQPAVLLRYASAPERGRAFAAKCSIFGPTEPRTTDVREAQGGARRP